MLGGHKGVAMKMTSSLLGVAARISIRRALVSLLFLVPFAAQGSVITYTTQASFFAAASGLSTIDFEAQQTGGNITFYGANLTVGGVSFTQADSRLFVFGPSFYSTSSTSNYLNHNDAGTQSVVINFTSAQTAVGMAIGCLENWHGTCGSAVFSLNNGDTFGVTTTSRLAGTAGQLAYIGFISDTPFTSLTINDPAKATMIDNFSYGTAAVPLPASLALLLFGLVGLLRRR